jgi:hypothetical protein
MKIEQKFRAPTPTLITKFPVKMNTRSVVVKVATTLQDTAFGKLLIDFSTLTAQIESQHLLQMLDEHNYFPETHKTAATKAIFLH